MPRGAYSRDRAQSKMASLQYASRDIRRFHHDSAMRRRFLLNGRRTCRWPPIRGRGSASVFLKIPAAGLEFTSADATKNTIDECRRTLGGAISFFPDS